MDYSVSREDKKDYVLLKLAGSATIYTVARLKSEIEESFTGGALALDLEGLQEMDSAGIQLLLYFKNEGKRLGRNVALIKHSPVVLKVIDLYGLAAQLGDRIKIPARERNNYSFRYGLKRS